MSISEELKKAQALERQAINRLNQERSWVQKHPGWMTLITVVLFVVAVVAIAKCAHG